MRYFYLAPENELSELFSRGIKPGKNGEINIIVLKDDFLMDKFLFDVIANEVYGLDHYCLFNILLGGIHSEPEPGRSAHAFSSVLKILRQDNIESKYLAPYQTDTNYEGMGLVSGVFPVENKDKFTPAFKQKIMDYLKALGDS